MINTRFFGFTIVTILLGGLVSYAYGNLSDGGCNLDLTRPCRTNSSLCVPLENILDGYIDCPDGSDEECESWQHECLCGFPRCIDKSKVGDGNIDCVEGSDELAIEKKSYICPDDLLRGQHLLYRRKRQIVDEENSRNADKIVTNFYPIPPGTLPTIGILKSTIDSFINKGTTSEYFTQIEGTSIGGKYAQVTSLSSRTFFALPTKLGHNQVNGLVSSYMRTTISNGYTQTITSRIYHTNIDGTYAQLVEAETKGLNPTQSAQSNVVTILQGEKLQGTFLSEPQGSIATLQFSHLEGSLNPNPVAEEVVTVTGTHGKFIRDAAVKPTTYSVFTGSYVKDQRTYVFFFGNSALPYEGSINMKEMLMEEGGDKRKVILDMERKDMKMIMPSEMKMKKMAMENELFLGEGMVDGHKMDGVFIANSDGFDVKGAQKKGVGDIKMMTVTIAQPSALTHSPVTKSPFDFFGEPAIEDNEVDGLFPRGRKVGGRGKSLVTDVDKIVPTRPLPFDIPTFVIREPNQNIADMVLRERIYNENPPKRGKKMEKNLMDNIKDKFNIDSFFADSELPTVTYYGFADFTTTIEDTVVVFTPNTRASGSEPSQSILRPRVIATKDNQLSSYSTATTKIFNTIDLYPSGLISSIGGTVVKEEITTLFTTLVYGTYIDGQYAQVVRSVSSILYLVSKSAALGAPTKMSEITMTKSPVFEAEEMDNFFENFLGGLNNDNAIGRSVSGDSKNENEFVQPGITASHKSTIATYTLYTTYIKDGSTMVSTNYKTTIVNPQLGGHTTKPFKDMLTHHTTRVVSGTTRVHSSVEVLPTKATALNDVFSDLFDKGTKETPTINLESSLNPEEEVDAIFFPRTYYTTYTYFTTYHKHNTSSIVSSLETITNILTDRDQLHDNKALTPEVPTYPVTYWTTYTYWTTLSRGNSSLVTSSKKTLSNVINLTAKDGTSPTNTVIPIEATPLQELVVATPVIDITTYYTTYTYYTTVTEGASTVISSRLETESRVVTGTKSSMTDQPFGLLFDQAPADFQDSNTKTGLLSTIRGSTVIDGQTTVFSTKVYGSYVDGLYVQIHSTTSQILRPTSTVHDTIDKTVLTVNAGSIIKNDITTHYTTQVVGMYVDDRYIKDEIITSKIEGSTGFVTELNPTKTGIVKEIVGSIIHGTHTTYYQSTVVGTLIDGIYSQNVQSTSRFVAGPSIYFTPLVAATLSPELEPSIEIVITPTPVIQATESLDEKQSISKEPKKSKNRLSFPIRKSSKKRTDIFPFIRRTSTFNKLEALSKVLAVKEETTPTLKVAPKPTSTKPDPTPVQSFRFGNAPPTRRFRFQERFKPKTDIKTTLTAKKVNSENKNEPAQIITVEEDTIQEPENTFRQFRFSGKTSSTGTRSSLPIRKRKNKNSSSPGPAAKFRFGSLPEPITSKPKTTPAPPTTQRTSRPGPFSFISNPAQKRKILRQRRPERPKPQRRPAPITTTPKTVSRSRPINRLSGRRRPITPRFNREESNVDYIYLQPDGTKVFEDYDLISFTPNDAIYEDYDEVLVRKRRQTHDFGIRTSSRGTRRFNRNQQNIDGNNENLDPSPVVADRQPFTLANPRINRARSRARISPRIDRPSQISPQRPSSPTQSKSRNTLPFRTRPNAARRSFRRPSSNNRFKISNRFTPENQDLIRTPQRRPSAISHNRNRNRVNARPPPNTNRSPIQSFLARPKPPPKPEAPAILLNTDGSKNEILQDLTVTREVPVTTTIPLLENGKTVEKQVITAAYITEIIKPEQITQTKINGEIKLLLSTIESEQKVTSVFIQPIETTTVTYTPVFLDGRRTSQPHILPSTAFNIVTVTGSKHENDVQNLLKLLLLQQQQQQNPLLAALGLGQSQTKLHTKTFVTTITRLTSTQIPIIFRGKPVITTVVDTNVIVVTSTVVSTEIVNGGSSLNSNPLGQLLPLLLSRKARDIHPTKWSLIDAIEATGKPDSSDLDEFVYSNDISDAAIDNNGFQFEATPPLSLDSSFLWDGPAEFTPLKRAVRSTNRGRQRFRARGQQARRIIAGPEEQILEDIVESEPQKEVTSPQKPTTYYTTFTYYTTLIDEQNNEFVKSSEETITQVATNGNVRFDEFTKTNPTNVLPVDVTSVTMQEKFLLQDAIIPGKPRPVPDPVFKDPDPPHGPVVRHDTNQDVKIRRPTSSRRRPQIARVNFRGQRTKVQLSNTVSVAIKGQVLDESQEPNSVIATRGVQNNLLNEDPRQRKKVVETANSYKGTVNTFYTVYSYVYSIYDGATPFSVSTRLITVSNAVRPTVVQIPKIYQTISPTSNLYTIEDGASTATLGERITDGHTTQIFLSSATLASIKAGPINQQTNILQNPQHIETTNLEIVNTDDGDLHSSLSEVDNTQTTSTPEIDIQDPITKSPITTKELEHVPQKIEETKVKDRSNIELKETALPSNQRGNIRFNSRGRNGPSTVRKTLNNLSSARRNNFISQRRRNGPVITTPKPEPEDTLPLENYDYVDEILAEDILIPFSEPVKLTNIFDNVFSSVNETTRTTPAPDEPITHKRSTFKQFSTTERTTTDTTSERITTEKATIEHSPPEVSSSLPPRPPRPSIRRDNIPIQRRPQKDKAKIPVSRHQLRFTTPKTTQKPETTTKEQTVDYYDDKFYDDYYYYTDNETVTTPKPADEKSSDKGGRAVLANSLNQFLGSPRPVGTRLKIDGRQNLSTKIMDNGVEVIVADDNEFEKSNSVAIGNVLKPTLGDIARPITLAPSTLSNQMLLFASAPGDKKTFYTTYTYYNTQINGNGQPTVLTSEETVGNVVTFNPNEKTKIHFDRSTYLTTHTFTRNVGDLFNPRIVTSSEIVTQVVVTESPLIIRMPVHSTLVTKTYFTTFTYYKTYDEGTRTFVETDTVISSDIVTETIRPTLKKSPILPIEATPIEVFATKTYFTTSTYLTTILEGDRTVTSSHIEVSSNIVTEVITTVFNTNDLLAFKPTATSYSPIEETRYQPMGDNIYKQLRTLFATYTRYRTNANGEISLSQVIKTKVLTAIVTTTAVPEEQIIKATKVDNTENMPHTETFNDDLFDSLLGPNVQLDPSFIEGSTAVSHKNEIKESSGLKATVHLANDNDVGTNKIVEDSTTSATLLVRPSDDAILASSDLPLVETTAPPFNFNDIFATPTLSSVITTTLSAPTFIRDDDQNLAYVTSGVSVVISTNAEGIAITRKLVKPTPTTSIRLNLPSALHTTGESENAESSGTTVSDGKLPDSDGSTFPISINPMLTAVAGLLGNTFVGKLAGQANAGRRKGSDIMMPKNAIVSSEKEHLFIPIGGVGASLGTIQEQSLHPEHGFIPLTRPNVERDFTGIHVGKDDVQSTPVLPVSPHRFTPKFRPPLTTERGFTAMTTDIAPTKVSVISGEETIFFGGFDNLGLPPSGQPHKANKPVPVAISLDEEPAEAIAHLSFAPSETFEFSFHERQNVNHLRPAPIPTLVDLDASINADLDKFLEATVAIGEPPLGGTGILSSEIPFRYETENDLTTVVEGLSTLLSGHTTIYDSLFTKPVETTIESVSAAVLRGIDGKLTKFVTRIESTPVIVAATKTRYEFVDGIPAIVTEVLSETKGYRTLVSTIVGTSTEVNDFKPTPPVETEIYSTVEFSSKSKLATITVGEIHKEEESNIEFADENLGYDEENGINRVNEISHSPSKKLDFCSPNCKTDEICRLLNGERLCICKPGLARKMPGERCERANSFEIEMTLDQYDDHQISFINELKDNSHPDTKYLMEEVRSGIENALKNSSLSDQYWGNSVLSFDELKHDEVEGPFVVARVKVDLAERKKPENLLLGGTFVGGNEYQIVDENSIRSTLEDSLKTTNYSIGGSRVYASRQAAILQAKDFDECQSEIFNDCHKDAVCINIAGSFTCKCKAMFTDVYSKDNNPGRKCVESRTCSFCNFHGRCYEDSNEEMKCICDEWFSGGQCQINMKVMLIAIISVGSFLSIALLIFLAFCCCRTKKDKKAGFLIPAGRGQPSTLDRRAMIADTSSSECSEEVTRERANKKKGPKKAPPKMTSMPKLPKIDYSIGRQSGKSNISNNRSVTMHTTVPAVMIPRIKGYGSNTVTRASSVENVLKNSGKRSAEAALVDILDGDQHGHQTQEIEADISVPSFGRPRQHHHLSSTGAGLRSRSSERLDRSGGQDDEDDFEIDAVNSIRYGNRTESQARSFDETTVRVPIRSMRGGESCRSRDMSQILSDGMPTNAERDGNSTIVYPQMQLYRPVREAESMSDLTGNPKIHSNDFFE